MYFYYQSQILKMFLSNLSKMNLLLKCNIICKLAYIYISIQDIPSEIGTVKNVCVNLTYTDVPIK